MTLFRRVELPHWATLAGYGLFTGMMAVGYYYNLTFVQLGLVDLGTEVIGMDEWLVAANMAAFALITCVVAVGFGWLMRRRGWSAQFDRKLRLAFLVAVVQAGLTGLAPFLSSAQAFSAWIVATSLMVGIGVPVTFGLTVDLIPVRHRGYVAAIITAAAFFIAAVFSTRWEIGTLAVQTLALMVPGTIILGILLFAPWPVVHALRLRLGQQHNRPEFAVGRFVRRARAGRSGIEGRLAFWIVLLFGVYFVDSLGFLRIIVTPAYMESAWHAPELGPVLFIGGMHVLMAFVAGVLYTSLSEKTLFLWIFGTFAVMLLMYTIHSRIAPGVAATLAMPMLYATAVSLYTTVSFALWADLSTPSTITLNAALGVGLAGWAATFLSTALSIQWRLAGVPVDVHLSRVAALAMLFFLITGAVVLLQAWGVGGDRPADEATGRTVEGRR
jgi:MFS family permease